MPGTMRRGSGQKEKASRECWALTIWHNGKLSHTSFPSGFPFFQLSQLLLRFLPCCDAFCDKHEAISFVWLCVKCFPSCMRTFCWKFQVLAFNHRQKSGDKWIIISIEKLSYLCAFWLENLLDHPCELASTNSGVPIRAYRITRKFHSYTYSCICTLTFSRSNPNFKMS